MGKDGIWMQESSSRVHAFGHYTVWTAKDIPLKEKNTENLKVKKWKLYFLIPNKMGI